MADEIIMGDYHATNHGANTNMNINSRGNSGTYTNSGPNTSNGANSNFSDPNAWADELDSNLLASDDRATKRSSRNADFSDARDRLAKACGYVDTHMGTEWDSNVESESNSNSSLKSRAPTMMDLMRKKARGGNANLDPRIASMKRGGGKARSASPLTGPSTTFTPPNTFTTTPGSFNFGPQQSNTGFGGSGSFTFGQQPSEANDMDRIESNPAPAPAASFTFGQSQPQQPSSNGFGQQNSNPFSGFGQQSAASAVGAQSTPSFAFGSQTQNNMTGNAPSNPFGGFGQQAQTNNNTSTSFSFGAQSQNGSPAPSSQFSGFNSQPEQNGAAAPSNSFTFGAQPSNTQPSANGSTTPSFSFGASQPTQQSTQTQNTSSLFAPQPSTENKSPSPFQGSTSLFSKPAEAPKADGWASFKSASPAAAPNGESSGASVLSGWQKEQTSKPTFSFTQSQMPTGDDDDAMASPEKAAPAKPALSTFGGGSNLFSASQTPAPAGNDLFSRISKPAEQAAPTDDAATPKAPASSGGDLFSRITFPDKPKEQTVSATPAPKASNPFTGFSVAPPATAPAKNLFASASNGFGVPATPTPAAEKVPETPATIKPAQLFSATPSLFTANTPKPSSTSSLFAPKSAVETVQEEPETPAPAEPSTKSLFSASTAQTPAASLFAPAQPQNSAPTPAPASTKAFQPTTQVENTPKAATQTTSLFTPASPQTSAPALTKAVEPATQVEETPKEAADRVRAALDTEDVSEMYKLNVGLIAALSRADPEADFSEYLKFYIKKVKFMKNETTTTADPKKRTSSTAINDERNAESGGAAKKIRQSGKTNGVDLTKSIFGASAAQTPKATSSSGLFGGVPATEPRQSGVKRSIEGDDSSAAPYTDKRRRSIEYPKLPAGASNTAKLFEAALDKPAESGAAAKSLFTPKPASTETKAAEEAPKTNMFGGFKPSTTSLFSPAKKDSAAPQTNGNSTAGSLFTPKPAASTATPKPAASGFMPTFKAPPAGGSNFLSAFGANASKAQDEARQKAMDEDFDSEDDDPEEWKKQYEEKQAAKRKAIEEAAKSGGGFIMKAPAPKPAAEEPEKAQDKQDSTPAGDDNTWKQGTPIKFGGGAEAGTPVAPFTAPPKSSTSMFGSAAASTLFPAKGSQTPQPPNGGSLFSSTVSKQSNSSGSLFSFAKTTETTSTTTPSKPSEPTQSTPAAAAATTNGETTATGDNNDDEDAAPAEPQVEDMTALQPAEKEESDILYHIEKMKSYKYETKPNADAPSWNYKALGPVWLLRNKTTGKTRLLQKVAPLGKAGMNFNLLGAAAMYKQSGKKVTASFIDHINEKEPKKPSQWFVQCGKEEDAKELARLMGEEAGKQ